MFFKNKWFYFTVISLSLLTIPLTVSATSQENLSYEIKPLFDDNQQAEGLDYFYFEVKPSEKKTVAFEIINHSNVKKHYKIQLNRAVTNKNGFIDYSLSNAQDSETMTADFNQLVSFREKSIEVAGNDKVKVTAEITIPAKKFKGIVLGGVYITEVPVEAKEKKESHSSGLKFDQQLAYAIAVMLQEEIPYKEGKEIVLHELKAKSEAGQSQLKLMTENSKPNVLKDVSVVVDIYKDDQKNIYKTLKKEKMSFAPNSRFELDIPWEQSEMAQGNYKTVTTIASEKDKWVFKNSFSISPEEVKKAAESDPFIEKQDNTLRNILIGVGALLLILITIILLKKRK
ncbi:hypothetical protein BFC19_05175 [Brochothrix thermosphacta]|uniref:DUF916 domain-containing protein n=1 Tax=Brochothrix thermosphacta TaxID=2756 RepID=UPI000E72A4FB|nr:DUF916 domain-containing protein [Brochothrix thermosphacta]ANZ94833.1 hypothetical protein BFC19_05175 [Brochothrix thermosphacta]